MIKAPVIFQRKILVDALVKQEAMKSIVSFKEYKSLHTQQRETRNSCEAVIKHVSK